MVKWCVLGEKASIFFTDSILTWLKFERNLKAK